MRPKQRHPGSYYHVIRRVHRREFRLRPGEGINGAVTCLVHDACEKHGLQVIAICVMGNHLHAVLYDPYGQLSAWMCHVFGTLARFLNYIHETSSHVWDAQELKSFLLGDLESVAKSAAYVIANPVAAGQVHSPSAWPGLCTTLADVASGEGPIHRRPEGFFQDDGSVSEEAMVWHECPPSTTRKAFRAMVEEALLPMLETARAEVKSRGRGYAGAAAVLALNPFDKPKTIAPSNTGRKARAVRTQVAATEELRKNMVTRRFAFILAHEAAREQLQDVTYDDDVIFPAGTWRHWRFYGAHRKPVLTQGFDVP